MCLLCSQAVNDLTRYTLPETNIAPENRHWKRRFLLETTIFRCYVGFREGSMGMCHEREPRLSSLVVSDSYQVASSTEICIEFPRRRTPKIMGINVHASNTPQGNDFLAQKDIQPKTTKKNNKKPIIKAHISKN